MRSPWRLIPFFLFAVTMGADRAAGQSLSPVELSKRGKEATALIEVRARTGHAAFCVHPAGLFVTSEQALRQRGDGDPVTLVLHPGLKTQKVHKARIVRRDAEANLALLQVERVRDLPVLPLGVADDLAELMELVAFGFPVGESQAEGEYPSLNVRTARISSLRRKAGELVRVRLDVELDAGFAGGAVLDPKGRVAGVVVGADVLPANVLARFLARPEVQFTPPAVTAANRRTPVPFEVRAVSPLPAASPADVELTLRGEDGKDRTTKLKGKDGVYRAEVIPDPATPGAERVRAALTFPEGSVTAALNDQGFQVGGKAIRLRDVGSIRFGKSASVSLHDGKTLIGKLEGLDAVEFLLDGKLTRVLLAQALELRCEPAAEARPVTYIVVVRQEGKEVTRLTGRLDSSAGSVARPDKPPVVGIKSAPLDKDEVTRMLPSPVADLCVGGGGRFLILHLPKVNKLAIFDASAGQIVKYLPVAEDGVKIAAGQDKLFVAMPTAGLLQRWSLATFEREVVVPSPVPGQVRALAMGAASREPLVIGIGPPGGGTRLAFLDPITFKEGEYRLAENTNLGFDEAAGRLRASADSSVLTGHGALVRHGKTYRAVPVQPGAVSSADGRTLFTTGQLFTSEGKPIGQRVGGHGNMVWYVPAVQGPYYLSLNQVANSLRLDLHMTGDSRPLVPLPPLPAATGLTEWSRGVPPFDRHVFLIPEAELLVILAGTNDRLILQRFNLEKLLARSEVDYLFVTSQPPLQSRPGAVYSYAVAIKSKKGGVKVKLEAGPKGMAVSPAGRLTWPVPSGFEEKEVTVILSVSDATGQECFHTFAIQVGP